MKKLWNTIHYFSNKELVRILEEDKKLLREKTALSYQEQRNEYLLCIKKQHEIAGERELLDRLHYLEDKLEITRTIGITVILGALAGSFGSALYAAICFFPKDTYTMSAKQLIVTLAICAIIVVIFGFILHANLTEEKSNFDYYRTNKQEEKWILEKLGVAEKSAATEQSQ